MLCASSNFTPISPIVLPAAIEVWAESMDTGAAAAVADRGRLAARLGARVMVDLWVHVPGGAAPEGVGVDDAGNVYAGWTAKMAVRHYVKQ